MEKRVDIYGELVRARKVCVCVGSGPTLKPETRDPKKKTKPQKAKAPTQKGNKYPFELKEKENAKGKDRIGI